MRVTIDKAGRMVVPRTLRAQLHIAPGDELEARVEGGELIARPVGPEVVLVEENGRLVATTNPPTDPMTTEALMQLIDESREWPRSV